MLQPVADGDLGVDRVARVAEQTAGLHGRQRLGVQVGIAEALLFRRRVSGVPVDRRCAGVTTAQGIGGALLGRDGDVGVHPAARTLVEPDFDDDRVPCERQPTSPIASSTSSPADPAAHTAAFAARMHDDTLLSGGCRGAPPTPVLWADPPPRTALRGVHHQHLLRDPTGRTGG